MLAIIVGFPLSFAIRLHGRRRRGAMRPVQSLALDVVAEAVVPRVRIRSAFGRVGA